MRSSFLPECKDVCPTKQTRIVAKKTAYTHQKITQKKCYDPCLYGRTEILIIFGLHFGRNDGLIKSSLPWTPFYLVSLEDLVQKLITFYQVFKTRSLKVGKTRHVVANNYANIFPTGINHLLRHSFKGLKVFRLKFPTIIHS